MFSHLAPSRQTQLFRELKGGGGESCKQGSFLISNLGGDPGTLTPSVTAKVNQNRVLLWYNKNETSVVRIFGTVRPVVRSNSLEQGEKENNLSCYGIVQYMSGGGTCQLPCICFRMVVLYYIFIGSTPSIQFHIQILVTLQDFKAISTSFGILTTLSRCVPPCQNCF